MKALLQGQTTLAVPESEENIITAVVSEVNEMNVAHEPPGHAPAAAAKIVEGAWVRVAREAVGADPIIVFSQN